MSSLHGELIGQRKMLGTSNTGVVYEQQMRLSSNEDALVVVASQLNFTSRLKKVKR